MGMMPLSIKIFFHVKSAVVYPIFFNSSLKITTHREENDQAFPVSL